MRYHGGFCSTILNTRHSPAHIDFVASQRFARLVSQYDYLSPSSPPSTRVLIAGDHECLRSSLKTMLELDPSIQVVGEAADDCETIKMARKLRPDVLLIDLDMRCCDKFEAVAEINRRKLAPYIIALTIHNDERERAEGQQAGVNIFLEKGVPYKQLIKAVRSAPTDTQNRQVPLLSHVNP